MLVKISMSFSTFLSFHSKFYSIEVQVHFNERVGIFQISNNKDSTKYVNIFKEKYKILKQTREFQTEPDFSFNLLLILQISFVLEIVSPIYRCYLTNDILFYFHWRIMLSNSYSKENTQDFFMLDLRILYWISDWCSGHWMGYEYLNALFVILLNASVSRYYLYLR